MGLMSTVDTQTPSNNEQNNENSFKQDNDQIKLDSTLTELSNGDDHGEMKTESDDSSVDDSNSTNSSDDSINSGEQTVVSPPHPQLPRPEAPPGVNLVNTEDAEKITASPVMKRSFSSPEDTVPAIGKFFREKSSSLSAAITKRLSFTKESENDVVLKNVTEINLSGVKVTVKLKNEPNEHEQTYKGKITFFSRSNCRDSTAVRSYFRDLNLKYTEINIDVYPTREQELIQRSGSNSVPQIFFNEKLFGGLVALNSLRNCGLLEERMKELLSVKSGEDAPVGPVYGFDDYEEEVNDEMVEVVRVLRQRLPIQDRIMKMKIVKNCFSAGEMVEVLIHQFDCGRKKFETSGGNRSTPQSLSGLRSRRLLSIYCLRVEIQSLGWG
nr:glutaredoxin-related protein [Tanacetum cinerariifolium]GEZ00489.1 glutaredoxin-related protein [Tanacetum cinerariifolium]